MKEDTIEEIYELLEKIKITKQNKVQVEQIRQNLIDRNFDDALEEIRNLIADNKDKTVKKIAKTQKIDDEIVDGSYPKRLQDPELEKIYIGLLLNNPKAISMYYFLHDECLFENQRILNIYKSVLFTEGQAYASELAKKDFNFPKEEKDDYEVKVTLRDNVNEDDYNFEEIYTKLKKLFVLRKSYMQMPIRETQDKIAEIIDYDLYHKMTVEEVYNAVNQVTVTQKFKKAVLNDKLTSFLLSGDNNLTNGLQMPFPIISNVFKGMRKGETMAFAMPSNAGKSRFTVNLAAYIAFVHKKKVLIISNEMSEEKTRLCLTTTIINNPEIQKLHGQKVSVTEGELLALKFKPDNKKAVKVDEDGYILREENEKQSDYIKKLEKYSSDFNKVVKATNWLNKQIDNSLYFINITDHTNEELQKVIMNYYYKEKIEYVFYDTMKTDTANIGNAEELKRTATILSNLAQNFEMFIGATVQLAETNSLPVNLTVNDLAVSRTVKEVLDTLTLVKQINREFWDDYEYSKQEVDTKFLNLEKDKNPDVRYYVAVIDKNRAGAKPKVLLKINLAYNTWQELGYVRLKQKK